MREAVTQAAVNAANECPPQDQNCINTNIKSTLEADQIPIRWKSFNPPGPFNIFSIPGWLLSALAITMGAPFWFDILNKFVNVRNAGPKPPSSPSS